MNDINQLLESVRQSVQAVLPESLGKDIKTNVSAVVASAVKEFDLVSREELDIQMEVLKRTRDKLTILEEKVTALENREAKK